MGFETFRIFAVLIGCDDIDLIFDGASAQQRLPMCSSRIGGESRGNKYELGSLE